MDLKVTEVVTLGEETKQMRTSQALLLDLGSSYKQCWLYGNSLHHTFSVWFYTFAFYFTMKGLKGMIQFS